MKHLMILAGLVLLFAFDSSAQLSVSSLIDADMVLQRQVEIPLRGSAAVGSTVEASLNGQSASVQAASDGSWELALPAMEAGGPYVLTISSGVQSLSFDPVWIGDVWLASGQSNMAWTLNKCDKGPEEIAGSGDRTLPQYRVYPSKASSPQEDPPVNSHWRTATPEQANLFSGVAYFFAKHLQEALDIPIGILNSSYGGSKIEAWINEEHLGYDENDRVIERDGEIVGHHQPNALYNSMVHPLRHTPIKGVIWYQGESNWGSRETALEYMNQLDSLVAQHRDIWGEGLPFIWVQLPNYGTMNDESNPSYWTGPNEMRSAMSRMLQIPGTGMAVCIDLGKAGDDVHPTNKEPVGKRLSVHALNLAYGDNLPAYGPRYRGHRDLGNGQVELSFDHVGDGLLAKDSPDGSLKWFQWEADGARPAKAIAHVQGDKVIVEKGDYNNPVWLRYAWEQNPSYVNFFNRDSLPAEPFKIYLEDPGFRIYFFNSSTNTIERDGNALLSWEVNGAERVELNGVGVDTTGAYRVFPQTDSGYILKAWEKGSGETIEKEISITVQQPYPEIQFAANGGPLVPYRKVLDLEATAWIPEGGEISHVCFYTDGVLTDSLLNPPYTSQWKADTTGSYLLWAKAVGQGGLESLSDTLERKVVLLETDTLEAEKATLSYGIQIIGEEGLSGGSYIDLVHDWRIGFDSIYTPESGTHQLFFVLRMAYGKAKWQYLQVNGGSKEQVLFLSDHTDRWEEHYLEADLDSGYNRIDVIADWGLIQMDYLGVDRPLFEEDTTEVGDTTSISDHFRESWAEISLRTFPNPAGELLRARFNLEAGTEFRLSLIDMAGRETGVEMDGVSTGKRLEAELDLSGLNAGPYLLLLNTRQAKVRKLVIIR